MKDDFHKPEKKHTAKKKKKKKKMMMMMMMKKMKKRRKRRRKNKKRRRRKKKKRRTKETRYLIVFAVRTFRRRGLRREVSDFVLFFETFMFDEEMYKGCTCRTKRI